MRQYTNESQTAKLIELGFEKTNVKVDTIISDLNGIRQETITFINDFSIGELIEMLGYDLYSMHYLGTSWEVKGEQVTIINEELINALYDMCIKLKEKEEI